MGFTGKPLMKKINVRNFWALVVVLTFITCFVLLAINTPIFTDAVTRFKQAAFGVGNHSEGVSAPQAQVKASVSNVLLNPSTTANAASSFTTNTSKTKVATLLDRYPLPHKYPIGRLVGMEIYQAEEEHSKRLRMLFDHQKLGDAYRIFLPGAQAGDADSMWELSQILVLCDAPGWRGEPGAPRLEQCKGVPENSQAEALRLLALSAREGNMQARRSMLYFSLEPAGYTPILAADPVLYGLVQQEILASLQYFTTVPVGGYIQRGYNVYSDGVVPPNLGLAAAYTLASYSLQKSNFPEDTDSSIHKANFVAQAFDKISPSQHAYAIRKAQEILNICCGGIAPVTNFSKFRKP
jgi:hypothetical protein